MKPLDFKIIKTADNRPEVLVYRDRNENSEDFVRVLSFESDTDSSWVRSEEIEMPNEDAARAFIRDYSVESAAEFQDRHFG